MAESNQSEDHSLDLDTAITQVASLLGELEPDLSDNPEDKGQSEEPEDQDQADESDDNDTDDEQDDEQDDDQDQGADDDADDEEDESDDEGGTDTWSIKRKVKIDGEEFEVTPEEALLGYQRQSATTRRFQEAAELKKKFNEALEATQTEQQKYVQALQVLENAFTGALNEPNWEELRKDPARYEKERVAYLERKEQLRQLNEARQQAEQQAQATAKQTRDSRLEEQRELLMTAIPEWVDADRASKESADMVKYAMKSYGYSAEDFSEIDDHRVYVILRKAMLYDSAKGKPNKGGAKGSKPNSPSLKPGSKTPRGKGAKPAKAQQKALSRLKKTGSIEDAVEAVMHMIDD